jgi:hypothetical protein
VEALLIEFLTAAFKISPLLGFLGYVLWQVNAERKELIKQKDALFERVLTNNRDLKDTIDKWIELNRRTG